jgi:hypothetical protein
LHEILHIIGQVPGQVVVLANDMVFCERCDEGDYHFLNAGVRI